MIALDLVLSRTLNAAFDEVIETHRGRIEEGFCDDFAKYREAVGELRAFRTAKAMLNDIAKNLLNDQPNSKR